MNIDKNQIPSLIIFFKGFTISGLGILFHFLKIREAKMVSIIGASLILVSIVVFFIMKSISKKKKDESVF